MNSIVVVAAGIVTYKNIFRAIGGRIGRIELPPLAWKARALPLCNIRRLVFGPKTELCRLSYWMRFGLGVDGLEPPTVCL
jgi:hypothetical protein